MKHILKAVASIDYKLIIDIIYYQHYIDSYVKAYHKQAPNGHVNLIIGIHIINV